MGRKIFTVFAMVALVALSGVLTGCDVPLIDIDVPIIPGI